MIIQFETAKLLKEKGFEQDIYPCYADDGKIHTWAYFSISNPNSNSYYAVEQYLIQKWLREIHNIDIVISPERYRDGVNYLVQAQKWDLNSNPDVNPNFVIKGSFWYNDNGEYPTYELALEKGLQEALKLI